jgi:hypothetical protein
MPVSTFPFFRGLLFGGQDWLLPVSCQRQRQQIVRQEDRMMEVIPQQGKPPRPIAQLPNRSWVVTNTGGSIGWTTFSTLDSTLRRGKKKLHQSEASSLGKRQMGGVLSNHRAAACLSLACAGTQPGFCSALSGPSQPKLLRRAVDPSQARPRDRVSQHVAHPPLPQPLPRPDLRHLWPPTKAANWTSGPLTAQLIVVVTSIPHQPPDMCL